MKLMSCVENLYDSHTWSNTQFQAPRRHLVLPRWISPLVASHKRHCRRQRIPSRKSCSSVPIFCAFFQQRCLQVFDSGDFSEDSTFLLTDWLAHTPKEVLAKNFKADISAFDHIPEKELYIFPSAPPPLLSSDRVSSPQGTVPEPLSFALSNVTPTPLTGGSVKVIDSTTFKISKTIAAAEVTVEVGGMRELHVRGLSSSTQCA